MNITTTQIKALRKLLSKEDKENIALHTGKSKKTIENILQGDRYNDQVEELVLITAKQNLAKYFNIIADIEAKNIRTISVEEYRKHRQSSVWSKDEFYTRYMDIYLRLVSLKVEDCETLWQTLWKDYKDIIKKPEYCIDLFVRLIGVNDVVATRFYNKEVKML
ncbi:MAG: hypothetical protein N4A72_14755 [Bacteroidales bacterium]|jgi:hypothetical protein|nr:hypothetical protein [Bacteroidales bacterium]